MAKIVLIKKGVRNLKEHSTSTEVEYQMLTSADGSLLMQLSSFGSEKRQNIGAVSQSFQLDREQAANLIQILEASFNLK